MSGAAKLDVRYPIGGLFTALGLLLVAYGLITNGRADMYVRSTSVNINLLWGIVMLAFGGLLIMLAARSRRAAAARPAAETPEGQATERREHVLGLEKE